MSRSRTAASSAPRWKPPAPSGSPSCSATGISTTSLPTRTIAAATEFSVGTRRLQLIPVNIHSDDAVVVWDPRARLLLAGDTVEDTVTFVDEPWGFEAHLRDLDRLLELAPRHILPNHGDPATISAGGYGPGLLSATQDYIRFLQGCETEPELREMPLRAVLAAAIEAGEVVYFEAYEEIHRENIATVLAG